MLISRAAIAMLMFFMPLSGLFADLIDIADFAADS